MDVQLVMFKDNGERKDFPLSNPTTLVGRKEDCDIRIPLAEVSRLHAEIKLNNDAVALKDLESANGTFVNNKRIAEHTLAPGDRVVIGPVVFTVQIDGEPSAIKPAKTRKQRRSAAPDPLLESGTDLPEPDLSAESAGSTGTGTGSVAAESFGLGESDMALEALSESASMTFDLDELELDED